jgi:hypothetical protein
MNSDFLFIEDVVSDVFERNKGWANERSKKMEFVEPRQVAHWVLYYFTKHQLRNIAFYFGRRSHDVVIHSVRIVNDRLQVDYSFACKIRTIIDHIESKGYSLLYKYGRVILEERQQTLRFVTNYAKKPRQRSVDLVVTPNLVQRLIKERNIFLSGYDVLKKKKRRIERTTDLDKVITLAKEISAIEIKMKERALQHIK